MKSKVHKEQSASIVSDASAKEMPEDQESGGDSYNAEDGRDGRGSGNRKPEKSEQKPDPHARQEGDEG